MVIKENEVKVIMTQQIGICGDTKMKKYAMPIIMLVVFETIAITLWLTKGNLFYLFNFSYIGLSISLGVFLYIKKYKYARRTVTPRENILPALENLVEFLHRDYPVEKRNRLH